MHNPGASRRGMRGGMSEIEATSLRGAKATKQSSFLLGVAMDCFASLAKMVWTAPDGISVPDW
jgi:hypothetical protein